MPQPDVLRMLFIALLLAQYGIARSNFVAAYTAAMSGAGISHCAKL
jgi:hypothetical protein